MSQLNVDLIKNRTGTAGPTVPSLTVTGGVNATGIVTASQIVRSGGTSNQFLKGDGSVDSTPYTTPGKSIAMSIVFGS